MPYYKQVEVEVLGEGDRSFMEYGKTTNHRKNMVSCFIMSETNERFRICIKPDDELLRREEQQSEYEGGIDEFGRNDTLRVRPEHILATVKLDGRSEVESREFVFLDQNEDDFPEDGRCIISGATICNDNGVWKRCGWMFKDVGIDVTFESLQLGDRNQAAIPEQPKDLVNAFSAMGAVKSIETEERSKPGQIEVRLDRITTGKTVYKERSSSPEGRGELKGLQGAEIGDLEHTVGRSEGREVGSGSKTTYYEYVDGSQEPYVIFRFNYCSEKKLRKLGLLEPLQESQTTNSKRGEALKLAAAVQKQKPRGGPNAYEFRNLDAGDVDDGAEADDEGSKTGEAGGDEDEETGPSEDLPLGDLGEKLGALGMERRRKREGEEKEGEKKARAE